MQLAKYIEEPPGDGWLYLAAVLLLCVMVLWRS